MNRAAAGKEVVLEVMQGVPELLLLEVMIGRMGGVRAGSSVVHASVQEQART
jgi:hypothetical protein